MADITGTTDDDTLVGTNVADLILGLSGNDVLDGAGGADQLEGGTGDDTFLLDNADDLVVENSGEGVDVIYSVVSYALAHGVAVEVLSAYQLRTDALDLTGNEFDQTIIGSAGDNVFRGGGGADIFYGLAGNDTYMIDSADDVVIEAIRPLDEVQNDAIYSTVSYKLGAGCAIETLSAYDRTSTAALDLTGNEYAQYIIGNAGNNVLRGGGATTYGPRSPGNADYLFGYGGDDTYMVLGSSTTGQGGGLSFHGDRAYEDRNNGFDSVYSVGSYELLPSSQIEVLSAYDQFGTDPINLTGNQYQQTIVGNDGNNILDGGHFGGVGSIFTSVPDILYGRGGADTFSFSEQPSEEHSFDIVLDFTSGTDKISLSGGVFLDRTTSFSVFAPGALNPDVFVQGTQALDANDYLFYDQASGKLFFDRDGTGSFAAVLFAVFDNHAALTAADFTVI